MAVKKAVAKKLVVKFALNMCVVCYLEHPNTGLAVIAVPAKNGMYLVCNNQDTSTDLCKNLGFRVDSYHGARPVILVEPLRAGDDEGLSALRALLEKSYELVEQGDIPWLKKAWQ